MKLSHFTDGLIKNNPIFIQLVGMCPTLAVTTSLTNGIGMGLATTAVLTLSNLLISLIRRWIPSKIRIPIFIVVIATFVTIVGMFLEGFVPALYQSLGLFIPLIVVNCIILARAESFAFNNGAFASILDGLGMGIGFTLALAIISTVREIIGTGALVVGGNALFQLPIPETLIMILPPGAFLVLGMILAVINAIKMRKEA